MNTGSLGESREDYLEAILIQTKRNGACRPTDIATFLGITKPSVSVAIRKLEDEGYLIRDDWKVVLSENGLKVAEHMLSKHLFFRKWLILAGVDEVTAEYEACHIEHVISDESFDKVVKFMKETHGDVFG